MIPCRFDGILKQIVFAIFLLAFISLPVFAQTGAAVFNSIPSPLPPNVPSLGYQATGTAEWGDDVSLGGTNRLAYSAKVVMSDWALHSDYPSMGASGFNHPITLNIYAVDHSGPHPAKGQLLASVTQTFLIPWRPEPDPNCSNRAWKASDNQCYNGFAFTITFDLRSTLLTLPNEIIYGVAYNTNTWGYNPIGQGGPYESLNVGCANVNSLGVPPSVGTDVEPDALFWNTKVGGFYADGGSGGVGVFRRDTDWLGFSPAVQINAASIDSVIDDATGATTLFDIFGDYLFTDCRKGSSQVIFGTGTITNLGCKTILTDGMGKRADKTVQITVNNCTNVATGTVTSGGVTHTLFQKNINNQQTGCFLSAASLWNFFPPPH